MLSVILSNAIAISSEHDNRTSTPEHIKHLFQDAEQLFEKQQYLDSFYKYQEILSFDATHQQAIERIFEISILFEQSSRALRQQGKIEIAQAEEEQYREIIRYLLDVLTTQLGILLKQYEQLSDNEKQPQKEDTVELLRTIIRLFAHLKHIYQTFYPENEDTSQTLEKLERASRNYRKQLLLYE